MILSAADEPMKTPRGGLPCMKHSEGYSFPLHAYAAFGEIN